MRCNKDYCSATIRCIKDTTILCNKNYCSTTIRCTKDYCSAIMIRCIKDYRSATTAAALRIRHVKDPQPQCLATMQKGLLQRNDRMQ